MPSVVCVSLFDITVKICVEMSFVLILLSPLTWKKYNYISFKKDDIVNRLELFSIYLHITSNIWSIMNDINRIKVILVEKRQIGKWLAKRFWKELFSIFK